MIYAIITGRLAFDAELKDINGKKYIRAIVPQQDRKDGPTTWVEIMMTAGQNPDGVLSVLRKGAYVSAHGDLKVRAYNSTKDGTAKADVSLWTGRINVEQYAKDEEAPAEEKKEDPDADLPF